MNAYTRVINRAAQNKYERFFDNHLYSVAIQDKSNLYANRLIDAALSICGHTEFSDDACWDDAGQAFLAKFTR